jgi:hypothetical protein
VVYRELLRDDFEKLPAVLRRLHAPEGRARARGVASVRHQNTLLARLIGFPPAGENIPVDLEVTANGGAETWVRRFGDRELRSVQRCEGGLLVETMGPFRLRFRAAAAEGGLTLASDGARLWRIPVAVRVRATERGDGSRWTFDVEVAGIGRYAGEMELVS